MQGIPEEISRFLELAGEEGHRPFGRLERGKPVAKGREAVVRTGFDPLVQGALYLYFDCFDEAHQIAQDNEGLVGNWLHAIAHRREPDAWNSKYWYKRVHPPAEVFKAIGKEALEVLRVHPAAELDGLLKKMEKSGTWEPEAFVDLCDKWREKDGSSPTFKILAKIQEVEWRELLRHVAKNPG
jgi:hypothetical protein